MMRGSSWQGKNNLYKNSDSYKQLYNYLNYKGKKYNMVNETIEEDKDINIGDDFLNEGSPFSVIDGKNTDKNLWKSDKFDNNYELESLNIINDSTK